MRFLWRDQDQNVHMCMSPALLLRARLPEKLLEATQVPLQSDAGESYQYALKEVSLS